MELRRLQVENGELKSRSSSSNTAAASIGGGGGGGRRMQMLEKEVDHLRWQLDQVSEDKLAKDII
jgi:hypothetical protein